MRKCLKMLAILLTILLLPQSTWADTETELVSTFTKVVTTTNEDGKTSYILKNDSDLDWITDNSDVTYKNGVYFTLVPQGASEGNSSILISPYNTTDEIYINQIDLYFESTLQNVAIIDGDSGFELTGEPTTTNNGIKYTMTAAGDPTAHGYIHIMLSNLTQAPEADENIILKRIVLTGTLNLEKPSIFKEEENIGFEYSSYNGLAKCYYSIDYEDASLEDISNSVFEESIEISAPCTVTSYVKCGTAISETETAKLFGFKESTLTTTYQPTISAPTIIPKLPNGAVVTYSNSAANTPTNTINNSTSVITINGVGTDSFGASFSTPENTDFTILNDVSSFTEEGLPVSYDLGTFNLTVTAKTLTNDMIKPITDQEFVNQPLTPNIVMKDNTYTLEQDKDYTIEFNTATNFNVGTASFTITGKGNYTGTATGNFKIVARALTEDMITFTAGDYVYDGQDKEPTITVSDAELKKDLTENTDYTVSYSDRKNAGTCTVTITGKGNYKSSVEKSFTIAKVDAAVTTAPTAKALTYTGAAQELITAGVASGGAMQYSLDGGAYGTAIPTGTEAKTYTIKYKVVGDNNHNDTDETTIADVKINAAAATLTVSRLL